MLCSFRVRKNFWTNPRNVASLVLLIRITIRKKRVNVFGVEKMQKFDECRINLFEHRVRIGYYMVITQFTN